MPRIRPVQALAARQGVILLVVITLLTLFAVVGITFVIYAQAEASSMRAARQAETLQLPDADPEMLLAYFLNQMIFDTTNPQSAMQNWSLARNMYGKAGNTVPFNGSGRLQNAPSGYWNLNYATNGGNPDQDGAPNPPYTYPDVNSLFLSAVRPSDGAVLIPSFFRNGPNGPATLRANLGPPEDGVCDVKNLPDSPGLFNNGKFTPNDSIWMDLGFPVMRGPDGRVFKPLFAPLIQDLDGRANVNAHGNNLSDIIQRFNTWCISHHGYNPGEVSLDKVIPGANFEVSQIFNGNNGVPGRYDQNWWAGWNSGNSLADQYCPAGHFYAGTDIDCWKNMEPDAMTMPQVSTGFGFPWFNEAYSHSWWNPEDKSYNPNLYNYFDPTQNWYFNSGLLRLNDRRFPCSDIEALLRYSDRGSPALTSDLFMLCPNSFQNANTRRLVTTLSMDLARAGVMPAMTAAQPGGNTFQLAASQPLLQQYPTCQPTNFPAVGMLPSGEFGAGYYAMSNASAGVPVANRIDLNRGFVDYPTLGGNFQFGNQAGYQPAMQNRQQMAQEIFNVLCTVTGASCTVNGGFNPVTVNVNPGQPEYDALRYLAQLAVNIVDFVDFPNVNHNSPAPDDVMTMFNWNTAQTQSINNGWVFGTVLPRLVLNEAYVEVANTQADLMKMPPPQTASQYDVNCWLELHNPFSSDTGGANTNNWPATPTPYNGTARLYVPAGNYAAYRVLIAQTGVGTPNDNTTVMTQNSNVLGVPQNIQVAVDQYAPGTPTNLAPSKPQTVVLNGDNLNQVQPVCSGASSRNNNVQQAMKCSSVGGNQGFFVLGPTTPFSGTGTVGTNFFATLPVKETTLQNPPTNDSTLGNVAAPAASQNSMHYFYTPGGAPNVQQLNHTFVLQRLACPYMPPSFTPGPNFNPYVTVDYILNVPANDGITIDNKGQHQNTPVAQRFSVGRNQPYAADNTQQVQQKGNYDMTQLGNGTGGQPPPAAPMAQQTPQNTFFCFNTQNQANQPFAYDWLFWANRLLISPMELLHVSGYKPSQLTQMFVQGPTQNGKPASQTKFLHRAPWFPPPVPGGQAQASPSILYRALEFFEAGLRPQWSPIGGRFTGRINLNTIWDQSVFNALCDQPTNNQTNNYFTAQAVTNMYNNMMKTRTPNGVPQVGDRPFLGMAAPYAAAGGQYPNGVGINDTFLRADPNPPAGNPQKRLFEADYTGGVELRTDPRTGQPLDQIYLRNELMIKIFGNTTTRSNTFAVWLTVGFFEVTPNGQLGLEINKLEGRNVRHRMFAVLDRTNLTIDPANPGQPGPRPFFINSLNAVTQPGATTITVPASATNAYEEMTWSIQAGNQLVVDTGINQETVTVTGVAGNGQGQQITATFAKAHAPGFAVTNAILGNPGPQPFFDPRNAKFSGIVRYFSIIQ